MVIDLAALINEHLGYLFFLQILIHILFILFDDWSFNLTNRNHQNEQITL